MAKRVITEDDLHESLEIVANKLKTKSTVTAGTAGQTAVFDANGNLVPKTATGTENFIPKFSPNSDTLANSQIFDNGTNVGVGTTSPKSTFSVSKSGANFSVSDTNKPTGTQDITILAVDGSTFGIATGDASNALAGIKIAIKDNGNIGIGTTDPTSKLQVVGLLEFADNAAAISGGLTEGAFYRTGDLLKVVH